jgi:hypothetical protein
VAKSITIVVTEGNFGESEEYNDIDKVMDFFDKHKLDMWGYHEGVWYVTGGPDE